MNGFSKTVFPIVFVLVIIFLLFFSGIPGFRDGAHFYAPLFQYLYDEVAAGHLPLWNPYENLGQPLAANPTTAFFYPVTLLTLGISVLFRIDPLTAYTGYAAGHFLLALFLCYRLARCWGCSRESATLAAFCYTFSGNILFQWNNVPFLVGAAWLPEAIRQADRMINRNKIRYAIGFGVVLALMILGGDLQSAYNAILCAAILWLAESLAESLNSKQYQWKKISCFSLPFPIFCFRVFRFRLLLFLLSGMITFFLAAVQILPAWELGTFSDRTLATHQQTVYSFSVPPWRFVEFLLPCAGGWQFPENARWFSALPFDNEIWVPSFYMGFLPVVLAFFSFCKQKQHNIVSNIDHVRFNQQFNHRLNHRVFVSFIIFLFFSLGSLGNWFIIYPILTYLPSYGMFRYPAKLLVVATLMLAILAGTGFNRLQKEELFRQRIRFILWFCYPFAVIVLIITLFRINIFPNVPNCPLFGTFNIESAQSGLLFTAISVFFFTFAIRLTIHWKSASYFLILFVALDLMIANTWMFAVVPNHKRNIETSFNNTIAGKKIPVRIYRFPVWYPAEFATTSSKQRLAEAICWDKKSLFPKYTLPQRICVLDVRGTLMPKDYNAVAGKLRSEWKYGESGIFETHLAQLGVQYIVAPDHIRFDAEQIDLSDNKSTWKIRNPLERSYVLFEPNRLILDVSLQAAETVIIPEQYWRGWRAFLENGTEIPVKRVQEIFRGVDLPAGKHRLTMIYDPPLVKIGAILSLSGFIMTLFIFIFGRRFDSA
ncbi:MAG: YfhO family protein [Planctomycetaceae bacterium]|jgi:hypothetical protein|nr:YfhO family protein [Planctomycetaceae bacterium]